MISALDASWSSLGTFLSHLVGLLVALGASLGASWDLLGLLGRLLVPLGPSLGPCWHRLAGLGVSRQGLGSNMDELPSPEFHFWKSMFFFVIALWVGIPFLEMKF